MTPTPAPECVPDDIQQQYVDYYGKPLDPEKVEPLISYIHELECALRDREMSRDALMIHRRFYGVDAILRPLQLSWYTPSPRGDP